MNNLSSANRAPIRIFILLAAGATSALCLMYFLSGRAPGISRENAALMSFYLTWHSLYVTVSKLGLDNYLFARGSQAEVFPRLGGLTAYWVLPTLLVYSYCIWKGFNGIVVPFAAVAAYLDLRTILLASIANAKSRSNLVAISTVLHFPAVFLTVLLLGYYSAITFELFCGLNCVLVAIRYIFLRSALRVEFSATGLHWGTLAYLAVQQVLNHWIFRVDQLMLSMSANQPAYTANWSASQIADYLFMAKAFELACGFWVVVGIVYFPIIYGWLQFPAVGRRNQFVALKVLAVMMAVLTACLLFVFIAGTSLNSMIPLFVLSGMLAPIVNFETYGLLRRNNLRFLILALVASVLAGALFALFGFSAKSLFWVAMVVPVQLVVFIAVVTLLNMYPGKHEPS